MQESPNISIDTNIAIRCKNKDEAQTIYRSLNADNVDIPASIDLNVKADQKDFSLLLKFNQTKNRENNINTLINTIDEIMEHISLIRNVINID